jgi:hypothetical protein
VSHAKTIYSSEAVAALVNGESMTNVDRDVLKPSDQAMLDLLRTDYLKLADVVAKTTICDATIIYEVFVVDWLVWRRVGHFGTDRAHRAAGAAFVALAQEQEAAMHEWAAKIVAARAA